MEKNKIHEFRRTLRRLERLIDSQQKICCSGATLAQCHVLLEVEEQGQTTTGRLADSLDLDKSTISRTIDGLVNLGFLERLSNRQDRRTIPISLTKKGKSICDSINSSSDALYTKALDRIPNDLRQQVIKSFEMLVKAFADCDKDPACEDSCTSSTAKKKKESEMDSKNYFDSVAAHWDNMRQGFFRENLRAKAFEVARIQPGRAAADIGAGTGFITEGLFHRGLRVIAVDRSKAMLEVLKNKLPSSARIDRRVGEAENLPLEDNHVDYVFANMYLHHVLDPAAAVKEMVRVLKPGGRLVITDIDKHLFTFLKAEHHDRWMGFKREDVERWFQDANMKEIQVTNAGEQCCAESDCGSQKAQVSIFIASGTKPYALD